MTCNPSLFTADSDQFPLSDSFPDEYMTEFSKISRGNRDLEERAKGLADQMRRFRAKLSEFRELESELERKDEELRVQGEENEIIRRDLVKAWARIKEMEDSQGGRLSPTLDRVKSRNKLAKVQTRLSRLTTLAQMLVEHTAKMFPDSVDPTFARLSDAIMNDIQMSKSGSRSVAGGSRGPSPSRVPFDLPKELRRGDSEIAKTVRENESLRKALEDAQGQIEALQAAPTREVLRSKTIATELHQKNATLEATISQLETKLLEESLQEEQLRSEQEALERDCEELKKENLRFIEQLEWMGGEQREMHRILETREEDIRSAVVAFCRKMNENYEKTNEKAKKLLQRVLGKIGALLDKVVKLAPNIRNGYRTKALMEEVKHLKEALTGESQRSESVSAELKTALASMETIKGRLTTVEKSELKAKNEIKSLKAKLQTTEEEDKQALEAKASEVNTLQQRVRDGERIRDDAKTLGNELAALRKTFDTEKKNFEAILKTAESDKSRAESALKAAESQRSRAEAELKVSTKRLESDLKSLEGEKNRLEASLKLSENQRIQLEGELKTAARRLESEAKSFESRLDSALKSAETQKSLSESDLKAAIKHLESELKQCQVDKSKVEAELQQSRDAALRLKQEASSLETRCKALESNDGERMRQLDLEASEMKHLRAKLDSANLLRVKFQRKLLPMKGAIERVSRLRKEIVPLLTRLCEWSSELHEKLLAESGPVKASAKWSSDCSAKIAQLTKQITLLQEENSMLGSENSFLNQEAEHLKSDLLHEKGMKITKESAIEEASSAIQAIHASWKVSSQENNELYEISVALQLQLAEAVMKRDEYYEQVMMLREDWVRVEERTVPMSLFRTQVKRLEKENERKEKELDQVTESLFKLVRQQEEQQEILAQKERALNRAEEERFRLEQLLSSSRKIALEEVETLNKEVLALKEQLNRKEFQIEKMSVVKQSLETWNADLRQKLAEAQNKVFSPSFESRQVSDGLFEHRHFGTEATPSVRLPTSISPEHSGTSPSLSMIQDIRAHSLSLALEEPENSDLSETLLEEVKQLNMLKAGELICKRVVYDGIMWILIDSGGRKYRWTSDQQRAESDSMQSLMAEIESKDKELGDLRSVNRLLDDIETLIQPYITPGDHLTIAVSKLLQEYEQMKRSQKGPPDLYPSPPGGGGFSTPEISSASRNLGGSQPVPVQSSETDYIASEWQVQRHEEKFPYSHLKDLIGKLLRYLPILSLEGELTVQKVCSVLAFSWTEIEAISSARKELVVRRPS